MFANKVEALIENNYDIRIDELEEELKINLESLQITESSINAKIENLKLLDEVIGVCLMEDELIIYSNEQARNQLSTDNKEMSNSFSTILSIEDAAKLENNIKQGIEVIINTIIDTTELKLFFIPIKNTNKRIVLIY